MKKLNLINLLSKQFLLLVSFGVEAESISIADSNQTSAPYKRSLTLGYTAMPPHIYEAEDGTPAGPLVEMLGKHIAPEMGLKIELVKLPLPRVFKAMSDQTIDGMAFGGKSVAREQIYHYPQQHLTSTTPVLVLKHNTNTLKDTELRKMKVGYIHSGILTPYVCDRDVEFSHLFGSKTWHRNLKRLMEGRIDAVYSPSKLNMAVVAREKGITHRVTLHKLPEEPIKWFTVFSKSTVNQESQTVALYDQAMERLGGHSLYERLLLQHLDDTGFSAYH